MNGEHQTVHLVTRIEGVALPAWLALCLAACAIIASASLLMMWKVDRELEREIRILQVHTQDIESVLERQGIAHRRDFATWEPSEPSRPEKEK